MRFACYERKSTYSDKSDSVSNQGRMCREYAELQFRGQVESWNEYRDEDFTGANTDRPDLKRLLKDIKLGVVDALIVYQLDRLSRSVRDFSNIYSLLEEKDVKFISVKEHIDTSTAIGKAMMYVTVVFAQMERETIAARVTDNVIGLAKKGYWRAGRPPIGYTKTRVDVDGKKHITLIPDPEGVKYRTWLIDTFLASDKSLAGLARQFRQQGTKAVGGGFFSKTQIYQLLKSPYCVADTPEIYDYFEEKGCIMNSPREEWDGKHGIVIHGRRTPKSKGGLINPYDKWIVCIGYHEPIVPGEKWLAVQRKLEGNLFDKTTRFPAPLLKGIIKCKCGYGMGVRYRPHKDGSIYAGYYCRRRMEEGSESCSMPQISADRLDNMVLDILREIDIDPAKIKAYLPEEPEDTTDIKAIDKDILNLNNRIAKLTETISTVPDSVATKYLVGQIEKLDLELQMRKRDKAVALSLDREKALKKQTADDKAKEIAKIMKGLEGLASDERNAVMKRIITSCVWDGEVLHLRL